MASGDRESRAAEGARQPDERQADKRGRVLRFDAFEETDAECFHFEATRAIKRLLALDVAADFIWRECARDDARDIRVQVLDAGLEPDQRAGRVKVRRLPSEGRELCPAAIRIAGFVEDRITEGRNLVRADDERVWMSLRDRSCLRGGKACGAVRG